jgi:hypothetical protein
VLIPQELEGNIIQGKTYEFARELFAETPFCLGYDLSSEKKKRERAPAAQGADFNDGYVS